MAELLEEVQQVVGILAGGVEADDEGDGAVAAGDGFEPLAEQGVAGGGLGEGQFVGGGLEVVAEEGGVVAVAGGVDADADAGGGAGERLRGGDLLRGSMGPPEKVEEAGPQPRGSSGRCRTPEEACDERSGPQDVTSSGSDAEGSICSKRSSLSRPKDLPATPPDEDTPDPDGASKMNIQADRRGMTAFRGILVLSRPAGC